MGSKDNFEWDDNKAVRNLAKHNVQFEEAMRAFGDPFAIEEPDDGKVYREERFVLIGMAGNRLLTVIYTERNKHIRIISARKATKDERKDYYRKIAT